MPAGILCPNEVKELLVESHPPCIQGWKENTSDIKESSIDLPLGDHYYEMPASCRPYLKYRVQDLVAAHKGTKYELKKDTVFEARKVYLVKLAWDLKLPERIYASSTARSSIGRLDVFVRLIGDNESEFDRVGPGKQTDLYAEVIPISFPIKLSPGTSLSQIRFSRGQSHLCTLTEEELEHEIKHVLVKRPDIDNSALESIQGDPRGILLSLNLEPDKKLGFSGFVAKKNDPQNPFKPIDVTRDGKGKNDPAQYWDPVKTEGEEYKTVRIEADQFYIFRSVERFQIPSHLAVECQAYSETLGDIRIHYAGFAHPWWGYHREGGTPLIFEVRGFGMTTILGHETPLAKVYFRRMSGEVKEPGTNPSYQEQELQLSNAFSPWVSE